MPFFITANASISAGAVATLSGARARAKTRLDDGIRAAGTARLNAASTYTLLSVVVQCFDGGTRRLMSLSWSDEHVRVVEGHELKPCLYNGSVADPRGFDTGINSRSFNTTAIMHDRSSTRIRLGNTMGSGADEVAMAHPIGMLRNQGSTESDF